MAQRGQLKAAKRGPVESPMMPPAAKAVGKAAARTLGKGVGKAAKRKKRPSRHLAKLTSKQRAEYMVRTRERKSKKMGR